MQKEARINFQKYKELRKQEKNIQKAMIDKKAQKSGQFNASKITAIMGVVTGYFLIEIIANLTSKYMKKK